ncbi:MAG: hypothetical protein JKY49_05970 [Cohaesibacteraceae bacterium]|nr:hypothetical protein [Cohaesibacteraceae bacterium]
MQYATTLGLGQLLKIIFIPLFNNRAKKYLVVRLASRSCQRRKLQNRTSRRH